MAMLKVKDSDGDDLYIHPELISSVAVRREQGSITSLYFSYNGSGFQITDEWEAKRIFSLLSSKGGLLEDSV